MCDCRLLSPLIGMTIELREVYQMRQRVLFFLSRCELRMNFSRNNPSIWMSKKRKWRYKLILKI